MKVLALIILFLVVPNLAAESNAIFDSMTPSEQRATGIDKLSDSERKALQNWISGNYAKSLNVPKLPSGAAPVVAPSRELTSDSEVEEQALADNISETDRRGLASVVDSSEIESQIVGRFTGWKGRTVFTLKNGQIWSQTDASETAYFVLDNPQIRISRGLIGGWYLRVIGQNSKARVRRVK